MMVGVNVSSFRLKKKNSRKDVYIPFYSNFSNYRDDCKYSCEDVIGVIEEFYKSKITPEQMEYHKKYFGVKNGSFKIEEKNDRVYVFFTVICGGYGLKSDITDIDTNKVLFEKKVNNADVKDFRVMFAFEKNQEGFVIDKGAILFQVIGLHGVKTLTTAAFKDFLSKNFNITPFFYTLSTRQAFEKLVENGSFKKIHLIKNQVNPKFSSMFGINCGKEVRTVALTKIKEKQGFVDKLLQFATSDKEVYEIDDNQYDDISLTVDVAGRIKTTSIKELHSFYMVDELPNSVINKEGEIIIPEMDNALIERANSYLDNIVEGSETDE